jgi:site-specific DNA-methyltransferase (adenine-specific)
MNYTLHLGDCIEYLKALPDASFDALVTDPPFTFAGGLSNGRTSMADDQFFLYWWRAVCQELNRVLKPDGEGFIWCDWRSAAVLARGFAQDQVSTWRVSQMLYHYREMPGMGQPFRSSVDMIAYVRGPKAKSARIPNTTHNLLSKYWYYGKHEHHPAEKDPELAAQLILWCSDPGMSVLDPFCGSAAIGVGCAMTGRVYTGIEVEETHHGTAERRLSSAYRSMPGTWRPKTDFALQAEFAL